MYNVHSVHSVHSVHNVESSAEIKVDCNGRKKEILIWSYTDFDLKIKKVKYNIFEIRYDNHNFIMTYKNRSQATKFCEAKDFAVLRLSYKT